MDESRILITGADGQLGKALCARYPKAMATNRETFDITSAQTIASFKWSKIDTIINAAAYTNVDEAETAQGRVTAWRTNASAVGYLAQIAAARAITLFHISSDYVFDGTKDNHAKDEPLSPLGVYGQTKAAGDIAASVAPKHYIIRTSWVIGDGHNFVRTMIDLANKNISPKVVNDQIGRLTFAPTIVAAVDHLATHALPFDTYNITNGGEPASWADITRTIFKQLGRDDLTVTSITTGDYFKNKTTPVAPRPRHSTLDLGAIQATGLNLRDWRDDLDDYVKAEQGSRA